MTKNLKIAIRIDSYVCDELQRITASHWVDCINGFEYEYCPLEDTYYISDVYGQSRQATGNEVLDIIAETMF